MTRPSNAPPPADLLESILRDHAERINYGNNAVIFRVDPRQMASTIREALGPALPVGEGEAGRPFVLKVNKRFVTGQVRQELEAQYEAGDILRAQGGARAPEPYFWAEIPAKSDDTRVRMQAAGVVDTSELAVIGMELLSGEDLATTFFDWILDHAPESKRLIAEIAARRDFHTLHAVVALIVGFSRPGGRAAQALDREYEARVVELENAGKVFEFLRRRGFVFPARALGAFRQAFSAFRDAGFCHEDVHARNLMMTRDGEETFIIDFAKSRYGGRDAALRDTAIVAELETLSGAARDGSEVTIYGKHISVLWQHATEGADGRLQRALRLFRGELGAMPVPEALERRLKFMSTMEQSLDAFVAFCLGLAAEGSIDREVLRRFLESQRPASGQLAMRLKMARMLLEERSVSA